MPPKYPKCLSISNQIGDRRVEKVLETVFRREKDACKSDERAYDDRVQEVKARIEHRHGIIMELKKLGIHPVLKKYLADLHCAEREDFDELGWLFQMKYRASVRAADKSNIGRKLRRCRRVLVVCHGRYVYAMKSPV
ncbi:hypothetical protein CTI12_AA151830 [Artemisia annua]|uniref:Uncharacterized protein n=1 Tax=Artemisia annua TaxID=35608 RepID=A0A2U1PHA7_ARTAN|nr:hypothetical protein CTI12_AA151830 [Artemisia annua]